MGADAIGLGRQIYLVKTPEPLQKNIREAFPAEHNGISFEDNNRGLLVMGLKIWKIAAHIWSLAVENKMSKVVTL